MAATDRAGADHLAAARLHPPRPRAGGAGDGLAGPRALRPWVWARRAPALAVLARTHPDALLDIAEASLGEDRCPRRWRRCCVTSRG
ncbi:MAG: hypothetical protein R3F43_11655 [bacterium]